MSKPKKGPSAKKFIDSVMSELNDSDKSKATSTEENTGSQEIHNIFLDGLRPDKKSEPSSDSVIHIESMDVPEPPEGLVPTEQVILDVKEKTVVASKPKAEEPEGLVLPNDEAPATHVADEPRSQFEDSVTVPLTGRDPTPDNTAGDRSPISDQTQPLANLGRRGREESVKVSFGVGRAGSRSPASAAGQVSDAQLAHAENLKLAQARITELENEIERLRNENDLLSSAGSIAKQRVEELTEKLHQLERARVDAIERGEMELKVARDGLSDRSRELIKAKKRIEELEAKVTADVRKIRVRERELENRLELARLEKTALVRAKDETLLDLKRNLDLVNSELESYKQKAAELQAKIDDQQEQLGRTVRALRLALTNLESSDPTSGQLVPIKKAE